MSRSDSRVLLELVWCIKKLLSAGARCGIRATADANCLLRCISHKLHYWNFLGHYPLDQSPFEGICQSSAAGLV